MDKPFPTSKSKWLVCFTLAAATFAAYWPAMRGGLVWDDDSWTLNLVRWFQNVPGLWAIWVHPTILQQYYPLTATTFWLDYQLWKFWTLPYHVENVVLHLLAVLLLWRLLRRLQLPGAWLAAAIFALHPVMVESAGWITERKNVLSLVFYLGALLAYLRYEEKFKVQGSRSKVFYGLALVLFLCALLAKTTAFSLPAVILLLAWWRRGRLGWRADGLPTLPFFALSAGMCVVTSWLEKNHVGAQGSDFTLSFVQRGLVAGRVFWFYLGKLIWPVHLCFVYPRWQPDPGAWRQWLYPAGAVGLLLALWLARKHIGRGPLAALLFYVGTLFPLLGFLNAYGMRYSFVWDHWVYLPSLGPLVLVAALIAGGRAKAEIRSGESDPSPLVPFPSEGRGKAGGGRQLAGSRAVLACGFAAVVLPILGVLTWHEARMFTDHQTLWITTLERNPACWMAHINLGNLLLKQGKLVPATEHYERALQLHRDYAEAYSNLGAALVRQGKLTEAITNSERALELNPKDYQAYSNLGLAFAAQGKIDDAIQHFQRALEINPDFAGAHVNLGAELAAEDRWAEAIGHYERALELEPDYVEAHYNLGIALASQGRAADAVPHFRRVLQLRPDFVEAEVQLGVALARQGQLAEGIQHLEQAVELEADNAEAHNDLGFALAAQRNWAEAIAHYERAIQLKPDYAKAQCNLGIALANQGKAVEAREHFQQALDLATAQGDTALAESIRAQLKSYQQDSAPPPAR